jgi:uncharacterized membrane protein
VLDFRPVLIWWLIIFIFGLVGWPLAFSLLRFLPDRGFALARPLGLLITGYILWLGATFRLLQNNGGGILIALILTLAIGVVWQWQQLRSETGLSMLAWLKQEWRYALAVETLFGLALISWAIFKAYNPNIETAGGEKWMEIAFINGALRSDYFPPQDPWLSGFAISYYYLGYVLMAMVTRLTGLVSTVAFNLYIPTLFALTLTAALGIVANLVSLHQSSEALSSNRHPLSSIHYLRSTAILTGLLAAVFVAILGNLEGLLEVLHKTALLPPDFWTWLDIRDLKIPPAGPSDGWIPDRWIWWWRASRVLTDYTLTGHEQEVIDEFPFFSFMLGDVHPHVLALPFVLLVVGLALNLLANRLLVIGNRATVSGQPSVISHQPPAISHQLSAVAGLRSLAVIDKLREILQNNWSSLLAALGGRLAFVLYALCLGSLSFLNTWDFPIYLSLVGLSYFAWLSYRRENWRAAIEPTLIGTALLGLVGVLLFLPFYATFQSQARGMLPNLWNPTWLPQFLVFFGPFLFAVIMLLIVLSRQSRGWSKYIGSSVILTVLGPVLVMLLALTGILLSSAGREYVQGIINQPDVQQVIGDATIGSLVQVALWRRVLNPWTFLFVGGLLGWALALFFGGLEDWKVGGLEDWKVGDEELERRSGEVAVGAPVVTVSNPEDTTTESFGGLRSSVGGLLVPEQFVLILTLVGLALPLSVEFIFLRDNFGYRMNTIFKFYFQAWVLLALASAFAVYYVSKNLRGLPALAWQVGMTLLVAGGLVYPVLATPNKTDFFQNEPTLDGIAWIADFRPGDYAAIQWLRQNAPAGAVILEAPGAPAQYGAYNYSGRVSAMTGLPTLLGWGGHQSQWRGNYDEPGRREPDIAQLYNTSDIHQAQTLLDKYNITYVYVGSLERERYSPQGLAKFERFMDVVFQQDDVTIYQRR